MTSMRVGAHKHIHINTNTLMFISIFTGFWSVCVKGLWLNWLCGLVNKAACVIKIYDIHTYLYSKNFIS